MSLNPEEEYLFQQSQLGTEAEPGLDWETDLALTNEQVAALTTVQREERVRHLLAESLDILSTAVETHVLADGRAVAGLVVLFSGGNDSTTLAHMFKDTATHAAHANTTVGVEQTRDFVRKTCESWGLPLIEKKPPREQDHYRALVLDRGFPGPAHHWKMFQRLKERALIEVRRELVSNPRKERVVFIAGRRRMESKRRARIVATERIGSIVWVSPLVNWTKLDMQTYRSMMGDVPRNEVSDIIHMSGECLCGAFASPGEREEVEFWFPAAFEEIRELEGLLKDREDIPEHQKVWGWTQYPELAKASRQKKSKSGRLCSSCDARFDGTAQGEVISTSSLFDRPSLDILDGGIR